jgi:hypothetical protein
MQPGAEPRASRPPSQHMPDRACWAATSALLPTPPNVSRLILRSKPGSQGPPRPLGRSWHPKGECDFPCLPHPTLPHPPIAHPTLPHPTPPHAPDPSPTSSSPRPSPPLRSRRSATSSASSRSRASSRSTAAASLSSQASALCGSPLRSTPGSRSLTSWCRPPATRVRAAQAGATGACRQSCPWPPRLAPSEGARL